MPFDFGAILSLLETQLVGVMGEGNERVQPNSLYAGVRRAVMLRSVYVLRVYQRRELQGSTESIIGAWWYFLFFLFYNNNNWARSRWYLILYIQNSFTERRIFEDYIKSIIRTLE